MSDFLSASGYLKCGGILGNRDGECIAIAIVEA